MKENFNNFMNETVGSVSEFWIEHDVFGWIQAGVFRGHIAIFVPFNWVHLPRSAVIDFYWIGTVKAVGPGCCDQCVAHDIYGNQIHGAFLVT